MPAGERLQVVIAPDGTIEVTTENIEPRDIAALTPVLEALLQATAVATRTRPAPPAAKRKIARPIAGR